MDVRIMLGGWLAAGALVVAGEPKAPADGAVKLNPELKAALGKLKLPGVKLNLEEWSVDVDARVCLDQGMLELIACTKDTKEHESIIRIEARPSHVHTALLLLGARNGSPAMQQAIDPEGTRFRHILPSGSPVDVFLVFKDEHGKTKERPINEFIVRSQDHDLPAADTPENAKREFFPTHTFLFAGSLLVPNGDGPKRYVSDESGHVISISTFGDELLCLPDIHGDANASLVWEACGEALPDVETQVILRLRPHRQPAPPTAPPTDGK